MGNCIDLHGHRFGKLLVSEKDTSNVDSTYTMWKCTCDCGKIISASCMALRCGYVNSCGCTPLFYSGPCKSRRGYYYSSKMNMSIRYDSEFERVAIGMFDDDDSIKIFNRSKHIIYYIHNGISYRYFPDFDVDDRVIEVKPLYKLNDEVTILKMDFAKRYCKRNGLRYEIWTEYDLLLR